MEPLLALLSFCSAIVGLYRLYQRWLHERRTRARIRQAESLEYIERRMQALDEMWRIQAEFAAARSRVILAQAEAQLALKKERERKNDALQSQVDDLQHMLSGLHQALTKLKEDREKVLVEALHMKSMLLDTLRKAVTLQRPPNDLMAQHLRLADETSEHAQSPDSGISEAQIYSAIQRLEEKR